jgi:hypothetical protein
MTFRFGFFVRLPNTCSPMYVRLAIIFRTWEFRQILALRRVRFALQILCQMTSSASDTSPTLREGGRSTMRSGLGLGLHHLG